MIQLTILVQEILNEEYGYSIQHRQQHRGETIDG